MADEEKLEETTEDSSPLGGEVADAPASAGGASGATEPRTPRKKTASKAEPEAPQLPESVFGVTPHVAVMHQALLRQLANARQGTAATKTRGDVQGGGRKPYRQKGTGRARHGSEREPSMVGGGTVFGPQPRSFAQKMPKKMRRLALRSALSVKAQEGKVSVVEAFEFDAPKTKRMAELLRDAGVESTVLVVLPAPNLVVQRSAANLPWAKVVQASNLSLYDLFTHDRLVIQREALESIEENFGE